MKQGTLPKGFPTSPEDWARMAAAAPDSVVDSECPYDPNDPVAVADFWKNATVSHSLPELREKLAARRRGAQKSPVKVPTTIRLDADVLEALQASGKGWQTRVNDALRDMVKKAA